jgi:hypothetical protein
VLKGEGEGNEACKGDEKEEAHHFKELATASVCAEAQKPSRWILKGQNTIFSFPSRRKII